MRRWDEQGAALITVLLLVAVMAVLAVALLDDIRFGIRRAVNANENGQAQWYALGAEALAKSRIVQLARNDGRTSLAGKWPDRAFQYPLDNGRMELRLADGGACFNLNSVVEGVGEMLQRRDRGAAQFLTLLLALGFSEQQAAALVGTLVDWIDSDMLREPAGAEDEVYVNASLVRRTAATLMAEASELRALQGVTEPVYRQLRPFVCALPTTDLTRINANTLPPDRAVLLTAVTDGRLLPADAMRLIALRPAEGWRDVTALRAAPPAAAIGGAGGLGEQVSLTTRFFHLEADVRYGDGEVLSSSLFEKNGFEVRLVSRRWGAEE
ncbi:MAG TPA: type II secretion system minor pseudopilin GspK [Rhizomicrobium sp.]|nr:type II secretion system minor pseudopilin GspK [Rhizomicrobium sp.]